MIRTMLFIIPILSLCVTECFTAPINTTNNNGFVSYVNLSHDPELGPVAEFGWEPSNYSDSGLPLSFVGTLAYLVYRAPASKCRGYDFSKNHPLVTECSLCHENDATMLAGKVIVSTESEPVTHLPSIRVNLCDQNPPSKPAVPDSNNVGLKPTDRSKQFTLQVPMKVSDASFFYIFYRCESSNVPNNGTERLKCENFIQEKCFLVNSLLDFGCVPKSGPMTVQPSRTVNYDNSQSAGDAAPAASPGLDDNESQPFLPLDRAPYTHGAKYGMEPVRVSLFRYSLLLLLLTLFGYAGCRWYSRSVQFRTVRRANGGGVFAAADGATGLSVLSRTLTGAAATRSTGSLLSTSSRSTATTTLSNNRTNTRLLLFNRYSPAAGGSGGRGRVYGLRTAATSAGVGIGESNLSRDADAMGQGGEIDEAIEACVRVLMRSDPNFAVQFAKNYRPNNSDATTAANQHQANNVDLEPTLPSYQEAVAQSSTSTSPATVRIPPDDESDFPPPPSPPVMDESIEDLSGEVGLDEDSQSLSGLPPPYPCEGGEGEIEEEEDDEFSMSEGNVDNAQWISNDVIDTGITPTSDVDAGDVNGFMTGQERYRDSPT